MTKKEQLPLSTTEYAIKNLKIVPVKDSISLGKLGGTKKYDKFGLEINKAYHLTKESKSVINDTFSYRKYSNFYNNFKNVVPNLSDSELYVNAIIHYLGLSDKPVFGELSDKEKNDIKGFEHSITLEPNSDLLEVAYLVVEKLFNQTISPSFDDKQVLEDTVGFIIYETSKYDTYHRLNTISVPKMVELKVILIEQIPELFNYYINNASDLVKYLLSTEKLTYKYDYSNKKSKAWFNLTSSESKVVSELISKFNENDLAVNVELFKRFIIAYKKSIDKDTYKLIHDRLYNKPRSFNSIINNDKDFEHIFKVVPKSILLRNLVSLVKRGIINDFGSLSALREILFSDEVPTRILVQLYNNIYTLAYNKPKYRLVKRGNIKTAIPTATLTDEQFNILSTVLSTIKLSLVSRLPEIMKDVDLTNVDYELAIPTSGESAPKSFRPSFEGTKISFDNNKDLSAFIYWKNSSDVDLSIKLIDDTGKHEPMSVSFTRLRRKISDNITVTHSGDIVDGSKGAVEEIFLPKETKDVYRYGLLHVISYSGIPLKDVGSLGFGFGNYNLHGKKSEVETKDLFGFSITQTVASPVLIDFKTGTAMLVNTSLADGAGYSLSSDSTIADSIDILANKHYLTYNELNEGE